MNSQADESLEIKDTSEDFEQIENVQPFCFSQSKEKGPAYYSPKSNFEIAPVNGSPKNGNTSGTKQGNKDHGGQPVEDTHSESSGDEKDENLSNVVILPKSIVKKNVNERKSHEFFRQPSTRKAHIGIEPRQLVIDNSYSTTGKRAIVSGYSKTSSPQKDEDSSMDKSREEKRKAVLFRNALEAMRIFELRRTRLSGSSDFEHSGAPFSNAAETQTNSNEDASGIQNETTKPRHISTSPIKYTPEEREKVVRDRLAKHLRIHQHLRAQKNMSRNKKLPTQTPEGTVRINALPVYLDGYPVAEQHREHLAMQLEQKKLRPLIDLKEVTMFGPNEICSPVTDKILSSLNKNKLETLIEEGKDHYTNSHVFSSFSNKSDYSFETSDTQELNCGRYAISLDDINLNSTLCKINTKRAYSF